MTTHLLTGDDEAVLRSAVQTLVDELVGDDDRTMMVDEFDGEEYELRAVVDAAQTPPFLTDRRVVVARSVGRFSTDDVTGLLDYVGSPLDTTELVLVGGGGRIPKQLTDAVKADGTVVNTSPPTRARDRREWVAEQIKESGLTIRNDAVDSLVEWLGEDAGRLDGVLATLRSTYGLGHPISVDEVQPFLGEAGGVPPWDFTDAIDAGRTTEALQLLARMMHAGGRHPLQVMSILHNHYAALARIDGADVRSERDVMAVAGISSPFPAKKALQNYRRMGGPAVARAIELLAAADLDLRGQRELPSELVMELLVARLSRLRR